MRAAFLALGEALVDAVAVGLVGDDEDAAVGVSGRDGEQQRADQNASKMNADESRMGSTGEGMKDRAHR